MLLPISHEDHRSRRWPWVTVVIVGLCVAVHLFFSLTGGVERGTPEVAAAAKSTVEYLEQHPYLTPPPGATQILDLLPPAARRILDAARIDGPPPFADVPAEQRELDRRVSAFELALGEARVFQYGFVPRMRNWHALFTCMFVHGGWLHLLGNLWILWLCGCNLEDRWGRPVFTAMYVVAGLGATLLHFFFFPQSMTPLIGASGAIAGAMGGFLVVFFYTKIRFAYFYFIFRPVYGTFAAPAYLMLPLWVAWEFASAMLFGRTGVAHWAHVGGFLVGFLVAFGLRLSGVESKLDAAVESAVTVTQDPRLLAATEHLDRRESGQAISILRELSRERSHDIDVWLLLSRAAIETRDDALRAEASARLVESYWAAGEVETALQVFEEPRPREVEALMPRTLGLRVARHFAASRQLAKARAACASLRRDGLVDEIAVRAAVLEATARLGMGDAEGARALLAEARESPFSTLEIDQMIETQEARLRAAGVS